MASQEVGLHQGDDIFGKVAPYFFALLGNLGFEFGHASGELPNLFFGLFLSFFELDHFGLESIALGLGLGDLFVAVEVFEELTNGAAHEIPTRFAVGGLGASEPYFQGSGGRRVGVPPVAPLDGQCMTFVVGHLDGKDGFLKEVCRIVAHDQISRSKVYASRMPIVM